MSYPYITFQKSAQKDLETLHSFIKDTKYDNGRNLEWAVFKKYPSLKAQFGDNFKIKNEEELRAFINEVYNDKDKEMDKALRQYEKNWKKVELNYFLLVDEIFERRKWPKGKYIAFGTIWGMYPRFLEDKTSQIPFWHNDLNYIPVVISHELLHFMFYDYFYERYPQYDQPEKNFFVWHISEIFNTLIQNSPTWLDCFKIKSLGYPEHEKIVENIGKKLYTQDKINIDLLTDEIIKEVFEEKLV